MATMTQEKPLTTTAAGYLEETADEIHDLVAELLPLVAEVHGLVDRRHTGQPSLGFLTPDARIALDEAAREERAGRIDTTPRPVGLQWMRGTGGGYLLGEGRLPGRHGATSCEAEIAFTLGQHAHRLEVAVNLAGVYTAHAYLDEHTTLGQLINVVDQYVDAVLTVDRNTDKAAGYGRTARRQLTSLRRDLEYLVRLADRVVNGVRTTAHGDCPHCGRPTIVVDLEGSVVTCDVDRKTSQHEPCRCGDDYCTCRYKPVEFRHTWTGPLGIDKFKRLRRRACEGPGHTQGAPNHHAQHVQQHHQDGRPVDLDSTTSEEHP